MSLSLYPDLDTLELDEVLEDELGDFECFIICDKLGDDLLALELDEDELLDECLDEEWDEDEDELLLEDL